ncbi:MAG TPA: hypothetical protein OIM61_06445 [Clostridiaceae bacterium]|nr:hypothetical protein [Clostridia bacterium]HCF34826.1 hypothetical protein [Clostridiales bacterium]HJJ18879.1 hypothetical protein [Clostridiaceae bacterium]
MIEIDKISEITRLFYDEHLRPTDIAKQIGVSKSYVTKIIQKDERYIKEKEYRSTQSRERHKVCKRNYINKKRQADKQEYQSMIIQINKDNEYLSTRKEISDIDFAKWNRGMYDYDKKNGDLVLKNGIVTGYNVCKRVKKVVNPSCIRATV